MYYKFKESFVRSAALDDLLDIFECLRHYYGFSKSKSMLLCDDFLSEADFEELYQRDFISFDNLDEFTSEEILNDY